jgi:hypothetical protein
VSPVTPSEDARTILINKISWGAVLAGVVVALVTQLLLNLLGIGIGASTIEPGTADNPSASSFSMVAAIWWAVSGIIAAFIGGYVASRLSGRPKPSTGAWHGLVSWAVTTLLVFFLLGSAIGGVIGGAFSTVSSAVGGLGRTAASVAQTAAPVLAQQTDPFAAIEQDLRGATGNDQAALRDAAVSAMRAVVTGDEAQAAEARERAAQALARAQNISVEEARTRVAQYEQQYRQAVDKLKQEAIQAAEVTAKAVSRGALLATVALLLGAIAAWFGGRAGAVEPTITARPLVEPTARV